MNKKLVSALAAAAMACTLVACGGQKPATDDKTEETTTTQTTDTAATTEEDGQNPVMNVIGPYVNDRATVFVEANGMEGARVIVTWANDVNSQNQWLMTGDFDSATQTITYTDAVQVTRTYGEDGSITAETEVYNNGTGSIVFGEGGTLTWQDDTGHVADGLVFTFSPTTPAPSV